MTKNLLVAAALLVSGSVSFGQEVPVLSEELIKALSSEAAIAHTVPKEKDAEWLSTVPDFKPIKGKYKDGLRNAYKAAGGKKPGGMIHPGTQTTIMGVNGKVLALATSDPISKFASDGSKLFVLFVPVVDGKPSTPVFAQETKVGPEQYEYACPDDGEQVSGFFVTGEILDPAYERTRVNKEAAPAPEGLK